MAVFLGDSYTQGVGADDPSLNFACLAARRMGWACSLDGESGTGYVNDGSHYTGTPPGATAYAARLAGAVAQHPDVLVISGGRNDEDRSAVSVSQEQINAAAEQLISRARRLLPASAQLVVVAPFWSDGRPPPGLVALRDAVKQAAAAAGATFIDPLAGRWITDANAKRYIGPDGIHPTPAGHAYLGRRLAAALRAAGVR